jgi:hypothetical protein
MLAPNHCRPCDPMVLGLLAEEARAHLYIMASWHLFMQNRFQAWLHAHPHAADITLVASSLFIDIFGMYFIISTLPGPTFRPFISLLALFALRQTCQGIVTLPVPPGSIWRAPGFPSLLVTYGKDGDYFFSGHTAVAVLGAIELWHAAPPWVGMIATIVALLEAATVLVLRAHYSMDIFTAALAAWCAHEVGTTAAPMVDAWMSIRG